MYVVCGCLWICAPRYEVSKLSVSQFCILSFWDFWRFVLRVWDPWVLQCSVFRTWALWDVQMSVPQLWGAQGSLDGMVCLCSSLRSLGIRVQDFRSLTYWRVFIQAQRNSLGICSPGCEVWGQLGAYILRVKWPTSKSVFVQMWGFWAIWVCMYDIECDASRLLEGLFQDMKILYCWHFPSCV